MLRFAFWSSLLISLVLAYTFIAGGVTRHHAGNDPAGDALTNGLLTIVYGGAFLSSLVCLLLFGSVSKQQRTGFKTVAAYILFVPTFLIGLNAVFGLASLRSPGAARAEEKRFRLSDGLFRAHHVLEVARNYTPSDAEDQTKKIAAHLLSKSSDPDREKPEVIDYVQKRVRVAKKKALRYGFRSVRAQVFFAHAMHIFDPRFDDVPSIKAVLLEAKARELTSSEELEWLASAVERVGEGWAEAHELNLNERFEALDAMIKDLD